jgi:hypothetical protein
MLVSELHLQHADRRGADPGGPWGRPCRCAQPQLPLLLRQPQLCPRWRRRAPRAAVARSCAAFRAGTAVAPALRGGAAGGGRWGRGTRCEAPEQVIPLHRSCSRGGGRGRGAHACHPQQQQQQQQQRQWRAAEEPQQPAPARAKPSKCSRRLRGGGPAAAVGLPGARPGMGRLDGAAAESHPGRGTSCLAVGRRSRRLRPAPRERDRAVQGGAEAACCHVQQPRFGSSGRSKEQHQSPTAHGCVRRAAPRCCSAQRTAPWAAARGCLLRRACVQQQLPRSGRPGLLQQAVAFSGSAAPDALEALVLRHLIQKPTLTALQLRGAISSLRQPAPRSTPIPWTRRTASCTASGGALYRGRARRRLPADVTQVPDDVFAPGRPLPLPSGALL